MKIKIRVVRTITCQAGIYRIRYINICTGKPVAVAFCRNWDEVIYLVNCFDRKYEGLM